MMHAETCAQANPSLSPEQNDVTSSNSTDPGRGFGTNVNAVSRIIDGGQRDLLGRGEMTTSVEGLTLMQVIAFDPQQFLMSLTFDSDARLSSSSLVEDHQTEDHGVFFRDLDENLALSVAEMQRDDASARSTTRMSCSRCAWRMLLIQEDEQEGNVRGTHNMDPGQGYYDQQVELELRRRTLRTSLESVIHHGHHQQHPRIVLTNDDSRWHIQPEIQQRTNRSASTVSTTTSEGTAGRPLVPNETEQGHDFDIHLRRFRRVQNIHFPFGDEQRNGSTTSDDGAKQ